MPYTLKVQQISVKDPDTGEYSGVDVLTEQTEQGLIAELQAEGDVQIARIEQAGVDVSDTIAEMSGDVQDIIEQTQSAIDDFESQKNAIAEAVASMANLGTDKTLSISGMAADAKAAGKVKDIVTEIEEEVYEEKSETKTQTATGKLASRMVDTNGISSAGSTYYVHGYLLENVSQFTIRPSALSTASQYYAFYDAISLATCSNSTNMIGTPINFVTNNVEITVDVPSRKCMFVVSGGSTSPTITITKAFSSRIDGLVTDVEGLNENAEIVVSLENDMNIFKGTKKIEFTQGKWIKNTGSVCDPTTAIENAQSYQCAVVPCSQGDVFRLSVTTSSTSVYNFSIIDADNNQLVKTGSRTTTDTIIMVPSDGKRLIINALKSQKCECYYGEPLPLEYFRDQYMIVDKNEIESGSYTSNSTGFARSSNANYLRTLTHFAKKGSTIRIIKGTNCHYYGFRVKSTRTLMDYISTTYAEFPASGYVDYIPSDDVIFAVTFQNSSRNAIDVADYDGEVRVYSENYFHNELIDYKGNTNSLWKPGWYKITTGAYEVPSESWVCTRFLLEDDVEKIKVPSDMKIILSLYNANMTYIGAYTIRGNTTSSSLNAEILPEEIDMGYVKRRYSTAKHFKLSATYTVNIDGNSSTEEITIDPEDAPNLVIFERKSVAHNRSSEVPLEYTAETSKTIDTVRKLQTEPCQTFIRFTDAHVWSTTSTIADTFFKAINVFKKLKDECRVSFIVDTGDDIDGTENNVESIKDHIEEINQTVLSIGLPFYKVGGNHDCLNSSGYMDYAGFYRYFAGVGQNVYPNLARNGTDFYFDNPFLKIRYIFLNENNASGGRYTFPTEMTDWLEDTALATEEGWQVMIFGHTDPTASHHSSSAGGLNGNATVAAGLIKQYEDESEDKYFMSFVYGHSHRDALYPENYIGINSGCEKFAITSETSDVYGSKPARSSGNETEQLFDVFIVKPISHKVHVVRFGAGVDRTVHYVTQSVSTGNTITLSPDTVIMEWASQNESVATVANGVVTGVASGTTGIMAYSADGNIEYWRISVD